MKIAYFLDTPYGLGGAGNLLIKQAKLMAELHEVLVVIPRGHDGRINEEYAARCERSGLKYIGAYYKTSYNFYSVDLLDAVEREKEIISLIQSEEITFLHSVQINVAVELAARELRLPHLMNIYQLKDSEFNIAYGDLFAKYHLCDSKLYSGKWQKHLQIESMCLRPIAPLEQMKEKQIDIPQIYKILMLGQICERKNQLNAIKAVQKCRKQYSVQLTIAGDEESIYASKCYEYVSEYELGEYIRFKGFVSNVADLLEENDCFLCASKDESFPSSLVEALTCDLTVISTPVAGVPEIFDENNSFLSIGYEPEDIAEAICRCIESYESGDILRIHRNAKAAWNENFEQKVIRERLNDYYIHIMRDSVNDRAQPLSLIESVKQTCLTIKELRYYEPFLEGRCLYYTFLKEKLKKGKAYLWGAGQYGAIAYELLACLRKDICVEAFIDKNRTEEYCGEKVISPEEIKFEKVDYFFVCFRTNPHEVVEYLEVHKLVYGKNIFLLP